jgi:predicted GIY-YIG superfamily endonuclease
MSLSYKSKSKKNYEGFIIYKIENPDKQVYIGATTNLERRLKTYNGDTRVFKNQTGLLESITKWTFIKHKITILKTFVGPFSIQDINREEMAIIELYYHKDKTKLLNKVVKGIDHTQKS